MIVVMFVKGLRRVVGAGRVRRRRGNRARGSERWLLVRTPVIGSTIRLETDVEPNGWVWVSNVEKWALFRAPDSAAVGEGEGGGGAIRLILGWAAARWCAGEDGWSGQRHGAEEERIEGGGRLWSGCGRQDEEVGWMRARSAALPRGAAGERGAREVRQAGRYMMGCWRAPVVGWCWCWCWRTGGGRCERICVARSRRARNRCGCDASFCGEPGAGF